MALTGPTAAVAVSNSATTASARKLPVLRRGPLHTWHAKRFLVEQRWGHAVPLSRRDIGLKAVRAALERPGGGLLHDASYLVPFRLEGPRAALLAALESVLSPFLAEYEGGDDLPPHDDTDEVEVEEEDGPGTIGAPPSDSPVCEPHSDKHMLIDGESVPPALVSADGAPTLAQRSRAQSARRRRLQARARHQLIAPSATATGMQSAEPNLTQHASGASNGPSPVAPGCGVSAAPQRQGPVRRRPVHPLHPHCVNGAQEGSAMLHAPGTFPQSALCPVRVAWARRGAPEPCAPQASSGPTPLQPSPAEQTAVVLVWVHAASLPEASSALQVAASTAGAHLGCLGGLLSRVRLWGPSAAAALTCAFPTLRPAPAALDAGLITASARDPRLAGLDGSVAADHLPISLDALCDPGWLRSLAAAWPSDGNVGRWRSQLRQSPGAHADVGEESDADSEAPAPVVPSEEPDAGAHAGQDATGVAGPVEPPPSDDPFMSGGDFVPLGPAVVPGGASSTVSAWRPRASAPLGLRRPQTQQPRRPEAVADPAPTPVSNAGAATLAGTKRPRPANPVAACGVSRSVAKVALRGAASLLTAAAARKSPRGHRCHGAGTGAASVGTASLCFCGRPPPHRAMNEPLPRPLSDAACGTLHMALVVDCAVQPLTRALRQRQSTVPGTAWAAYAFDVVIPTAALPVVFSALVRAVRSPSDGPAPPVAADRTAPPLARPLQVVGLEEMREVSALHGIPCFPFDHPDTVAGEREAARAAAAAFEVFMARPRSKRTNYAGLRCPAPFRPEWRLLWPGEPTRSGITATSNAASELAVVRDARFIRGFLATPQVGAATIESSVLASVADSSSVMVPSAVPGTVQPCATSARMTQLAPLLQLAVAFPVTLPVPLLTPAPTLLRVRVQLIGRGRVDAGAMLCALTSEDWAAWLAWDASAAAGLRSLVEARRIVRASLATPSTPARDVAAAAEPSVVPVVGSGRADASTLAELGFGGMKAHKKARLLAKAAAAGMAAGPLATESDSPALPPIVELPPSSVNGPTLLAVARSWRREPVAAVDCLLPQHAMALAAAGGRLHGATHAPPPWPGPDPEPPGPPHVWPLKRGGAATCPIPAEDVSAAHATDSAHAVAQPRSQEDWNMTEAAYLASVLHPAVAAAPPSRQLLGWVTSGTAGSGGDCGTGFLRAEVVAVALASARSHLLTGASVRATDEVTAGDADAAVGVGAVAGAALTRPVPRQALREAVSRRFRVPMLVRNPSEVVYRPAFGTLLGLTE